LTQHSAVASLFIIVQNKSGQKNADFEEWIRRFEKGNHYGLHNGMKFKLIDLGHISYSMKITEQHLSSPSTCHGGAVAGLMDAVLGTAALTLAFSRNQLCSTVEFKMNYFVPVKLNDALVGVGKVENAGKRLVVTRADIKNQDDRVVAIGQGTFNLYPMDKREFP